MDEANKKEVLRILEEYWSKPDNLGPEVWAEIDKAMADPCGHLEEIQRLRTALAESQARCARLEGAAKLANEEFTPFYQSVFGKGPYVRADEDGFAIGCDNALHKLRAALSSSGPSPLEAVREVEAILVDLDVEYGTPSIWTALTKLRAAFGLGGERWRVKLQSPSLGL